MNLWWQIHYRFGRPRNSQLLCYDSFPSWFWILSLWKRRLYTSWILRKCRWFAVCPHFGRIYLGFFLYWAPLPVINYEKIVLNEIWTIIKEILRDLQQKIIVIILTVNIDPPIALIYRCVIWQRRIEKFKPKIVAEWFIKDQVSAKYLIQRGTKDFTKKC